MRLLKGLYIMILQAILALMVLIVVCILALMLEASSANEIEDSIGVTFFYVSPFFFLIVIACVILGLPIRMFKKINSFWIKKQRSVLIVVLTTIFMFLTFSTCLNMFSKTERSYQETALVMEIVMISSAFVIAFGTSHFYPRYLVKKPFDSRLAEAEKL